MCRFLDTVSQREHATICSSQLSKKFSKRLQMFGSASFRVPRAMAQKISARNSSSIPSSLYNNVWRKSNVMYITYIATGCLVLGSFYGSFVSGVWESANRGKLYHQIDWSKFKSEDDE